jgi:phosphoglycolate phosphatase-like HAD superfamily hydrolase
VDEINAGLKENTIAIDFDGVVHKYSQGYQGLYNVYDPPTEGTREALEALKSKGYRLIIISSRDVGTIRKWLGDHGIEHYFDDVTNIKHPAKYYIDDHAIRFPKNEDDPWEKVLKIID